jgi:conjugal transfer pilus assembly protein TraF
MKRLLNCLILCSAVAYADPMAERGWYFYQDPIEVQSTIESQPNLPPQYKNWTEYNDAVKREFEEIQNRAIYNPTQENVKAYNEALRAITNNAVRFGMLTTTQNWQDPNSGLSLNAANGAGLQSDLNDQRSQISDIVKRYALFYFIDKSCEYCNVEANELKRLEYTYNMTVRVVSMDGTSLPQYPNPTPDTGISKKLGIQKSGQLVAFDSTNKKITTIGFGYIHFDQITQRLQTLFITGTADWDSYLKQSEPVYINRKPQ